MQNTSEYVEVIVPSTERGGKFEPKTVLHGWLSRPDQAPSYALRIQSRLGSVASTTLRGKGYEEFLPLYGSQRRWSDRIKKLELTLFSGYLFCQFDVSDRLPILTTPGVIGVVGAGKTPYRLRSFAADRFGTPDRRGWDVRGGSSSLNELGRES